MPTFEITSPDGKTYEVTGPEGSTKEQALEKVKVQHAAPSAPGLGETLLDVGKSGLIGIAKGAEAFPGAMASLIGMAGRGAESIGLGNPEEARKREEFRKENPPPMATSHLPEPKTRAGKYAESIGEFVPAVAAGGGSAARSALTAIGGGGSAGAEQLAEAYAPALAPAAKFVGGMVGGTAPNVIATERNLAALAAKLPTREDIKAAATAGYEMLKKSDVRISPEGTQMLLADVKGALHADNFRDYLAPNTYRAIEELVPSGNTPNKYEPAVNIRGKIFTGGSHSDAIDRAAKNLGKSHEELIAEAGGEQVAFNNLDGFVGSEGEFISRAEAYAFVERVSGGVTIGDLDSVRKLLGRVPITNPTDREAANRAIRAIDDFIMNVPDHFVLSGNPANDAAILKHAQRNWALHKQLEQLEEASVKGQHRAGVSGSGANRINTARQEVRKILDSDKKSRGMSEAVKDKMEEIVMGTWATNAARKIGKFAPSGPVSATTSILTGMGVGAGEGVAVAAGGFLSKYLGEYLTDRQIRQLEQLMRSESPIGKPIAREIAPQIEQQRVAPARAAASSAAALGSPLAAGGP